MSAAATKYANLPDIDTAPDVYETEDPTDQQVTSTKEDDDFNANSNQRRGAHDANPEELDTMPGMSHDEASDKFRKAEKRALKMRVLYESMDSDEDEGGSMRLDLRLKALQAELSALETAIADPTRERSRDKKDDGEGNEEEDVDAGELIRGLVDVRGRLGMMRGGRGHLVGKILNEKQRPQLTQEIVKAEGGTAVDGEKEGASGSGLVGLDERVGQLERVVGSSTTALDEFSPLPPPLVPLITRLNSQVTLLTQPRHIDSISRRLKLLLSDLDRSTHAHGRKGALPPEANHQQLLPVLNRLAGAVPQIPHILTRLKTLATLHAAAGHFEDTLRGLEEEQKKLREALKELDSAVSRVEASIDENRGVVRTNVEGLETRMDSLFKRLESI